MNNPIKTTCPYCGVGCGILASVDSAGLVSIKGDPDHPANFGRLCSKGSALGETVYLQDRLLYPEAHGEQVSWDHALAEVAGEFSKTIERHGPNSVAFYVSGQLLTEDYYVANKLMKGGIGSANIDTNSRLCMSSPVAAQIRAFGEDAVPVCYEDLEQARLIVLVGSNTAWCHPVVYQRIVKAKKSNPDLTVVLIDPRRTQTADIADLHLAIKPGTDALLWNGLLIALKQAEMQNTAFTNHCTSGVEAALEVAQKSAGSVEEVALQCGLPLKDVAEFFRLFINTEQVVSIFSQGINQSSSGTDKGNAIINCHLFTGRIGRPGMGPFSITGQPNAMGGREVGGLANQLAAHMNLKNADHKDRVQRFWRSPVLAQKEGLKAVDLFDAIHDGKVKALWIMATNPVVSMPDADKVAHAIKHCNFTVISDCVGTTDTAALCDLKLPALTWGERDGTMTNSERCISRQQPFLPRPGRARPDWWIITQVARQMGFEDLFSYETPADIFREHAALSGYENHGERQFDISPLADLSDCDYDGLQPVQWPIKTKGGSGTKRLFADGLFSTSDKKARFIPVKPRTPLSIPDENNPFILNTGRVRDHWHTMTRTGVSPRLSSHTFEPFVEIHPDDAKDSQLADGDLAQVSNDLGSVILRVVTSDHQQRGSLFVPMHWSDQYASNARIGTLVHAVVDPVSGQPESKCSTASIKPYRPKWHGFILSRRRPDLENLTYSVRSRGKGLWRFELAGDQIPERWSDHARSLLCKHDEQVNWIDYHDPGDNQYRAARFIGNHLESCLFVSPNPDLPHRDWLIGLFHKDELTGKERRSLLSGEPPSSSEDQGRIICSCFNIGEKAIQRAIDEGADTTEGLGTRLKAGTNCGSCLPELKEQLARNQNVSS